MYDLIPEAIIKGKILDIGAGNEEWFGDELPQLESKYRDIFLSENYLGIDINPPKNGLLNIIRQDLLTFEPNTRFDTILMIEVIEHISIEHWPEVFRKLRSWLNSGGYLFFSCPYNEPYVSPHPWRHLVFEITEKTVKNYLPDATFQIYPHPHAFAAPGENKFLCSFRYIKRLLTDHPFLKYRLATIWKKR
ncbi:MAG: SAM-dependent methyltransferase [Candidatus Heimdallarchaeota archaeon]